MIDKLIIGPWLGAAGETSPREAHPARIREWIEQLHHAIRVRWAICTYSPTVICAVIEQWDKDPLMFSWIVLRTESGKDTPLLDLKNPEWLAHFAIEDLYMRGEFDAALKDAP